MPNTIIDNLVTKRAQRAEKKAILETISHDMEKGGKGFLEIDEVLEIIAKITKEINAPANDPIEEEEYELNLTPEELEDKIGHGLEDIEEALSDLISDNSGFCHTGFKWAITVSADLDKSE